MLKQVRAATLMEGRANSHCDYTGVGAISDLNKYCIKLQLRDQPMYYCMWVHLLILMFIDNSHPLYCILGIDNR